MDVSQIVELIKGVGLPAVIALVVLLKLDRSLNRITYALTELIIEVRTKK